MKHKCIYCKYEEDDFSLISDHIRDAKEYSVIQCPECGLVQLSPVPEVSEERFFYDRDSQANFVSSDLSIKEKKEKAWFDIKWRIELIKRTCKQYDRILDVGTGYGFFIEELEKNGFCCSGIEISKPRIDIAKKHCRGDIFSLDILHDDLSEYKNKFDCITVFHVLEHISKPVLFLNNLREMLTAGGKIIIEVPNVNDHAMSIPTYRDFYWQRAHLTYFSRDTLEKVLKEAGFADFNIMGRQRYGVVNFMNWYINGNPQIRQPAFEVADDLIWLENYYKDYLCENLCCDTLYTVISNGHGNFLPNNLGKAHDEKRLKNGKIY